MSRDTADLYALVCVLSGISLLGIAGNVIVLYVFSRPTVRRESKTTAARPSASATVYVMALAAADLVTCLLDIPSTVYMEWVEFRTRCDVFCKFYQVSFLTISPHSLTFTDLKQSVSDEFTSPSFYAW